MGVTFAPSESRHDSIQIMHSSAEISCNFTYVHSFVDCRFPVSIDTACVVGSNIAKLPMQMWTPCSRMLFSAGRLGSMQALKTLVLDSQSVYGTPVLHSRTCIPIHGDRHAPPARQHCVRTYAATAGVSPEYSTQDAVTLHGGARTFDTIRVCGSGASKAKKVFSCSECGETTPQWGGKCPSCNAWNS